MEKSNSLDQKKRIRNLLRQHKKLIGKKNSICEFQQPILFFMRRSGKVEFIEDVTRGIYEYTHSDGELRNLILDPKQIQTFAYGNDTFKGYIAHEDHPIAFPPEPVLLAETVDIAIKKTMNDLKSWQTEKLKETRKLWWYILVGIALIILAYAVLQSLGGSGTPDTTIIQYGAENLTTKLEPITPTIVK